MLDWILFTILIILILLAIGMILKGNVVREEHFEREVPYGQGQNNGNLEELPSIQASYHQLSDVQAFTEREYSELQRHA